MNTLPAALNASAPADATAHASHTSGNARARQGADASFDDLMGDALDSQTNGSASPQTPTATTTPPTEGTDTAAPVFTTDTTTSENTEDAPVDPATLLTVATTSQVMLALAEPATPVSPVAAPVETSSEATTSNAAGNAVSSRPNPEMENTEQSPAPGLTVVTTAAPTAARTNSTQAEVVTVVAQSNPTPVAKSASATLPDESSVNTDSQVVEPEKNAADASEGSIKIPLSVAASATTPQKSTAQKSARSESPTTQSAAMQQDATTSPVLENLAAPAVSVKITSTGTDRAPEQAMQTLRDVWTNSAYRTLAFGSETAATRDTSTVTTETIALSSNDQFAEAVQNALNTPRELLPRRVEIQLSTPPGATVTLSLTRVNGELRAQFGANSAQALQWLNGEIHDLQNMNFGLAVRWSPPQLAAQQQQEETRTERDRQEQRRRDGTRRGNQPGMDAVTGLSSRLGAATSMKG